MSDFNPVTGQPPELEWVSPERLAVDPEYQRGLEARSSQSLIKNIAKFWDWRLCQPLNVARRGDGSLWVVDGQHRLEGAKLRGDIAHLPCVVMNQDSREQEAQVFVSLNRRRRPLNSVDVFKADIVAGKPDATAVNDLIAAAGLRIAPHSNYTAWKPGMLYCIPGIASSYRRHGKDVTLAALTAIAKAFEGHVLRYAGQMFRALAIVYATNPPGSGFDSGAFIERLSLNTQQQWVRKANEHYAKTGENGPRGFAAVLLAAYRGHTGQA